MSRVESPRPRFSDKEIMRFARELYGINASVRQLESYMDQNFHLTDDMGREFILKIANPAEKREVLDAQNQAMGHLTKYSKAVECPRVRNTISGEQIAIIKSDNGTSHLARMLTFLKGTFLKDIDPHTPEILHNFGKFLGTMDKTLEGFYHSAAYRYLSWDLKNALHAKQKICYITDPRRRSLVEHFQLQFETFVTPVLPRLRSSVIHNDANDYNVLLDESDSGSKRFIGIIDFSDMVYTHTVCELAVAITYAMLDREDPVAVAKHIIRGYHEVLPLTDLELEVLYYLICARLCISVTMSAYQKKLEPDNEYITVSEKPAWELLGKLIELNPEHAYEEFSQACEISSSPKRQGRSHGQIINLRQQHIGKSLSILYQKPLKIIRGAMQYLYDDTGHTYLDAVNNVPHVGHCHPKVVKAAQRQIAVLNTNTRYLHDNLVKYAQRLTSKMPEPLSVCFFVCTGSEANDLALRLARTHSKRKDVIVVDGAYHGTTTADIEMSPYKFDGPGGTGAEPFIHKVITPDIYRGIYKANDSEAGKKYAEHIFTAIERMQKVQKNVAAFICESLLGCGGQIILPENYLKEAFQHVRNAGGVCIVDEVQVGFGRVGSHFWGFETQGVVPDIVTLGKPIGNGHPLAAVVTTPELAESFDSGMEYFNTYGGNPVSCAVGLAVLDVIEEEKLQENALSVGDRMKRGLEQLMAKHPLIGDVRGLGLFIGVELVLDRETLAPATEQAAYIIERMKEEGILIGTEGPLDNILKIKPPLVFSDTNADLLVSTLDKILGEGALKNL
ncbi:aminotransferase class III-fold pyridoxal phosphate-dependent enzyme [candidate division KSB1 bacterium]|nr:aminotransferase class III-fold pyridoxal phosphate-dependent enzyme [candidate division KSB1 bacterium]